MRPCERARAPAGARARTPPSCGQWAASRPGQVVVEGCAGPGVGWSGAGRGWGGDVRGWIHGLMDSLLPLS